MRGALKESWIPPGKESWIPPGSVQIRGVEQLGVLE
jgi:hypothetical protein